VRPPFRTAESLSGAGTTTNPPPEERNTFPDGIKGAS
jgi:hypothetical protein